MSARSTGRSARRLALKALAAPATLRAVLGARRWAARAGREAGFQLWLQTAMAMLGRWIDPSPLPGEVNFHADRIAQLALQPADLNARARRRPRRVPDGDKMRVAVYGSFSGAISFGRAFFAAVPDHIELTVFDVSWRGVWADSLSGLNHRYVRIEGFPEGWAEAARIANSLDLDVFCNVKSKTNPRLPAALDTACVVNWNAGSAPYYGRLFDFELYPQCQRNYALADRRLVHVKTCVPIPDVVAYPSFWPTDPREGTARDVAPAGRRGPDIFFHGALYKLADRDYLDLLFRVMADMPAARLRFMGKHSSSDELALVFDRARAWGVADRVEHLGGYDNTRDANGNIADDRWQMCRRELDRARLWLCTFPGIGASARVEAYQSGAPVVQMGFPPEWSRGAVPIYNAWELPHLRVEIGTATDPAGYEALMRRILLDDGFADAVADAQFARLPEILDQSRVWRDLRSAHADWVSRPRDTG